MAKEHLGHFLEGQRNKWRGQSQNWTTQYGRHTQWKKTPLSWTCDMNGSPAHTSTGVALGGSGVQERSRSGAYKLEEHSQQGLVKDGNHLGGSGGGSSRQIRMASECACPMHPLGCWLNQGQGQVTEYNTVQYNANLYSAISRKRIGGAWRQCLDRLCGSVCRGKELSL